MKQYEIEPLNDQVIVIPAQGEEISKGGIIIPDTAKEKPQKGTVVAVGPGVLDDAGVFRKTTVTKGDHVIFRKYAGSEFELPDGKQVLIMRESDIMGKLKEVVNV
jgi:chaperonin GroES